MITHERMSLRHCLGLTRTGLMIPLRRFPRPRDAVSCTFQPNFCSIANPLPYFSNRSCSASSSSSRSLLCAILAFVNSSLSSSSSASIFLTFAPRKAILACEDSANISCCSGYSGNSGYGAGFKYIAVRTEVAAGSLADSIWKQLGGEG